MRKGGGKQKGAAWERQVCSDLSRLISPNTDETLFWRSSMSGGRSTMRQRGKKKDSTQAGDITCVHPYGAWLTEAFFIEAKFHKDLNIQAGLIDGRGRLATFWRIATKQAKSHKKEPMLIARENRCRTLLLLSSRGKHILEGMGYSGRSLLKSDVLNVCVLDYKSLGKRQ